VSLVRGRRILAAFSIALALAMGLGAGQSVAGWISGWFWIGDAKFSLGAEYKPDGFPAQRSVPMKLKSWMRITTDTKSLPPRVDEIVVDIEEGVSIVRKGLGVCKPERIRFATTKGASRACRRALVGRGKVAATVKFPGQPRFRAHGPLLVFNGVDGQGKPAVVMHTLAAVPIPTTFVIVTKLEKSPVPGFGERFAIDVPVIAQGNGVLSSFRVNLAKRPRGKRFLVARCPKGRIKVLADFDLHPEPPKYPEGRDFDVSMVGQCARRR
jgi:hypothetical protein